MKVLFVDDNELNRMVLNDMLEVLFEGLEIEVYDCAQAVLDLDTSSYDLILSDIDMPDIDGYELHDRLRKEHHFSKPIIAVTALAVSGDKEKMLMHGFDDYVSKPINMDVLEEVMNKYLKGVNT